MTRSQLLYTIDHELGGAVPEGRFLEMIQVPTSLDARKLIAVTWTIQKRLESFECRWCQAVFQDPKGPFGCHFGG